MTSLSDQPIPDGGRDSSVTAQVEQLYRSYAALVRSVCRSLLRDRVEAEDAVQQTFLSAQRALLNGSSPRDTAAWLATIARNESLARVQARMREPLPVEIGEYGAAPDAYTAALHKHEARELRDALAQLPRRQRKAILLREVQGLTSNEVATALSVTAYAAESLVFRARRSLRTRLQGALAGMSPGLWLQPLRDVASRIGSGGLGAPAAAKVAALGVGGLLVTGGALVGPRALSLGHGPRPSGHALRSAAGTSTRAGVPPASATLSSSLARHRWSNPPTDSDRVRHAAGNESTSSESSDGQTTDNSGTSAADNESQVNTKSSSDTGTPQQDGSGGSSGDSQSGTTDTGSTDSGSDSQTGTNPSDSQSANTPSTSGEGD
jgi:RNA polymerase sigma factor (sigma-70 family)